jgi:hypothetical protein
MSVLAPTASQIAASRDGRNVPFAAVIAVHDFDAAKTRPIDQELN